MERIYYYLCIRYNKGDIEMTKKESQYDIKRISSEGEEE